MTKRTRRILFYLAIIIFLLVSYVTILYAQGYKYSFSEKKFLRTGTIYLKANTDAMVFLNNKFINSTSFLGSSYTISRLLPGQYAIRLEKNGYSIWQKNVKVEEGLVTEFSKILLLPQGNEESESLKEEIASLLNPLKQSLSPTPLVKNRKPSIKPTETPFSSPISHKPFFIKNKILFRSEGDIPKKVANDVVEFALSGDKEKIFWWNSKEIWVLWLDQTDYQPYRKKEDRNLISWINDSGIKKAAWFRDSDHIVIETDGYRVLELDSRGGRNIYEIN